MSRITRYKRINPTVIAAEFLTRTWHRNKSSDVVVQRSMFMQAKWLKKQAGLRRRFQNFEFRSRFEDVICCTLATLERLSSQLESLIVRTEFCHARINRTCGTLSGAILGARLGGEIFVSEWRRSRRNVLALRSSMPRQVEWIWRGGDCAQLQVPRQKCEKRHRLDSGAPGRLGRSVCTIMHDDYELSVGFKRIVGR
jgi:hypothetical protein